MPARIQNQNTHIDDSHEQYIDTNKHEIQFSITNLIFKTILYIRNIHDNENDTTSLLSTATNIVNVDLIKKNMTNVLSQNKVTTETSLAYVLILKYLDNETFNAVLSFHDIGILKSDDVEKVQHISAEIAKTILNKYDLNKKTLRADAERLATGTVRTAIQQIPGSKFIYDPKSSSSVEIQDSLTKIIVKMRQFESKLEDMLDCIKTTTNCNKKRTQKGGKLLHTKKRRISHKTKKHKHYKKQKQYTRQAVNKKHMKRKNTSKR